MSGSRIALSTRIAIYGVLVVTAMTLLLITRRLDAFSLSPFPITPPLRYSQTIADRASWPESGRPAPAQVPVEYTLERGETLGDVLARFDLPPEEVPGAAEALSEHVDVRRLRAGDPYLAYFDRESQFTALEWTLEDQGRVVLRREAAGWKSSFHRFERRTEMRTVAGRLEGSLIESLEASGASAVLAYRMADVLQWDLDFNRDLRAGDRFEVLFEEAYLDGQYAGVSGVFALRYENAGSLLEAYRFGDEDSYYDAKGRPLRKMFLRSPLRFSRVTSRFSHRRYHPILKTHRPHYGVDYGAPVGTPVRVTGNGVVTFAGRNDGSGRMVKVRHPNGYVTAYLHLSRFGQGVRSGVRVHQGQVIGYVGSSGLSTGPHLDYRVQRGGRWIDPLSLKSVPAEPIPDEVREDFRRWRDALRASLDLGAPLPEPPAFTQDAPPTRYAGVGSAASAPSVGALGR